MISKGVIIPYKNVKYFGGQQKLLHWKRNEGKSLSGGMGGRWYPCCGLLVTSFQGFKARVDSLFVYFITCMLWIPHIHLWCDTC